MVTVIIVFLSLLVIALGGLRVFQIIYGEDF